MIGLGPAEVEGDVTEENTVLVIAVNSLEISYPVRCVRVHYGVPSTNSILVLVLEWIRISKKTSRQPHIRTMII